MSTSWTHERILRDPDDVLGQTVRSWRITREGSQVGIGRDAYTEQLSIRAADLDMLIRDLQRIRDFAEDDLPPPPTQSEEP